VAELHQNGIRLVFIGDLSAFTPELRRKMDDSVHLTSGNQRMTFAVAVNYGGQWDIVNACRQLASQVEQGTLRAEQITPEKLQQFISLGDLPMPDLCIRTGGENRISNFMLWQMAYAELYFTDLYWPDFDQAALDAAFADFSRRQRRFGRTSEQIAASQEE
jgi:undecaprenyl diphosphate synthase